MCRLSAITSSEYISPMENIHALETMKEGHDGSGLGLMLKDLGGPFADYKSYPTLSAICSNKGLQSLNDYMKAHGFKEKFVWAPTIKDVPGIERREHYIAKVYDYPESFRDRPFREKEDLLMQTRLALRNIGEPDGSLFVFSFYPDVAMIKEVGWPMQIGDALCLHDGQLKSRVCMAQGRQNTNYGINLYACHPFFIQGISTMTNGENTAFVPIRDWLLGKNFPGYTGYQSDSEVFTHILHYTLKMLKLPLQAYKHIITPLSNAELAKHPQGEFLAGLRQVCKRLIIDGPNAVIGTLPDETCLLVMDQKKLRPATVGGREGVWAIASEICGVDAMIPDRDASLDFQPMREHTVIIPPHRKELEIWSQYEAFPLPLAA